MVWFTSDQHFGHGSIIRLAGRPFESLAEMDAAMVAAWNGVVGDEDLVYQLGDFTLRGSREARRGGELMY